MKNKIAIASAFIAASSFSTAEIVVNDFLSFEGFVDMSYYTQDEEFDTFDETTNSFQIDQVEISWLFDFEPVTAQIDLNYEGGDAPSDNIVEQAFATYHFDNGGAITAGRFASQLGFEAFEPTGLYQYSFAYDLGVLLPGYNQGVKYTYESDMTYFGFAVTDSGVTDSYDDRLGGDNDADGGGYGLEAAFGYYMDNGLSFFLGGAVEDGDDGDSYIVNSYVTFETGAWIFAAEMNYGETDLDIYDFSTPAFTDGETEVFSALIMANFAYSDVASVTGRISYIDAQATDSDAPVSVSGDYKWTKFTLAHGYAFTDNLFLVNEISYADGEIADEDGDVLSAAVELIFSF